jgi:hypothetical protein
MPRSARTTGSVHRQDVSLYRIGVSIVIDDAYSPYAEEISTALEERPDVSAACWMVRVAGTLERGARCSQCCSDNGNTVESR